MEGDRPFSKFERWLEKEYPSVYEEEIYHRSEWPIGILLAIFGFFPWLLSNLTLGPIQIIGLGASFLGILLLVIGLVRYRLQLGQYSYHGLSRNTITDAIMYIDSKIIKPEELESPAPYFTQSTDSSYSLGVKELNLVKLMRSTAGFIVWPISLMDELKVRVEKTRKTSRRCSMTFLVLFLFSITISYYLIATWGLAYFVIVFYSIILCIISGIYFYLRYLYDYSPMFTDNWISEILGSDTIQLEETMIEIFTRLQSEFPYPLRFYLAREYPLLEYTGRTKTTYTLVRLKEAVLYPQLSH